MQGEGEGTNLFTPRPQHVRRYRSSDLACFATRWYVPTLPLAAPEQRPTEGTRMSLSSHQRPVEGQTSVWLTPPEIVKALGPFDLDPCAAVDQPWRTADVQYTEVEDGLRQSWGSGFDRPFVWCNPPFGPHAETWLQRMGQHGKGIALVPARTETRWFVKTIWRCTSVTGVLFLHGRPHFHHPDGTRGRTNSGAPICLVAYGVTPAIQRLRDCGLAGSLVENWNHVS